MPTKSMHRKLYEHVEEAIGLSIFQGRYLPGDTLPNEEALCAEFGVSRGVIREAVKVLCKKGLVRPKPKIGTQVQPRSRWNLFDADVLVWKLKTGQPLRFLKEVTEVRALIESEAAKFSAERATAEETAEIANRCRALEMTLSDEAAFDYGRYLEADMAFHSAILEASHNELLSQIGRTMRSAVHAARQVDTRDIRILWASQPFHAAIVRGIAERNPRAARAASREMFSRMWKTMPENIEPSKRHVTCSGGRRSTVGAPAAGTQTSSWRMASSSCLRSTGLGKVRCAPR